jgi:hypothetical protein
LNFTFPASRDSFQAEHDTTFRQSFSAGGFIFADSGSLRAETIPSHGTATDFDEVHELLRANLTGVTAENFTAAGKNQFDGAHFRRDSAAKAFPTCGHLRKLCEPGS